MCERTIYADVVALDQPFFWNRYGAVNPHGMIYALREDIRASGPGGLTPGNVQLRSDKRARPMTLRMNVGDCLEVSFQNLLATTPQGEQPSTRSASIHVIGMQLVNSIMDDGSYVGENANSQCAPGETRTYTFYGEREGTYLLHSGSGFHGGPEDEGGNISFGLFGAVNVEPRGAEWYRSQVTQNDMQLASIDSIDSSGHPLLDYDAVYPSGHPLAGRPILRMLDDTNHIRHTDLTAIITGPGRGNFPAGTYPPVAVYPDRDHPFREFTIIFHDEIGAVQAFPEFEDPVLSHTLHSVRDAFAINYGTGGLGAELFANRLGLGPVYDCVECKYEEFFLTSWAVGDPAMIVDVPANSPCDPASINQGLPCSPTPGPKATKAFYPDDPSNVYHSYMNDHVKFRNLHAGIDDHHIFHLHAHQWLHTPDSDNSVYLDSQAIGQGSSYTYEIAYHGSGNRNKTVGDSIFHCHFYPHFAQGMWSLWRVHDVFEKGTKLGANGLPVPGSRALPDGEITAGTPIPGIVPVPGNAMPPMPEADVAIVNGQVQVTGSGNPGYPFFIPGQAGHRPPHPALDTIDDGGLPRHIVVGSGDFEEMHTRLDMHKILHGLEAKELPETGTPEEIAAMNFHAAGSHPSFKPDGTPAAFAVNSLPPAPGAPFADPCDGAVQDRLYKAADIQLDAILSKEGWHNPQQRMISLWEDVDDFLWGGKPPEPLFFRANTGDCVTYYLANLVPAEYDLDDFEVRTPTDILGQHIHLVKFDVTSSDGGGNGFNYEDGTFSPDEVRERVTAINAYGGLITGPNGERTTLTAQPHPFFGQYGRPEWIGAQTTAQRWYVDDVLNLNGEDRTLRTVYTHDHFSPSTHQQAGLYAGLVVEKFGSQWRDPMTGLMMGTRHDGGPTSWRADILTLDPAESFREFMFEFGDMNQAYLASNTGIPDPSAAINPPGRRAVGPHKLYQDPDQCPGGVLPPCPEAISADDPGTMTSNYRAEPIASRVYDPKTGLQAEGLAGDLSYVFSSLVPRASAALNSQPTFYQPMTPSAQPGDPFTPLLEAYENDKVQIRILVGSNEEEHVFNIHGVKWLFEPDDPNSGFRSGQGMGISEHFEFEIPVLPKGSTTQADFLWKAGAGIDDLWTGIWGLMRVYRGLRPFMMALPNNVNGQAPPAARNKLLTDSVCPKDAPVRVHKVTAVAASRALPGGTLVYNSRPDPVVTFGLPGAPAVGEEGHGATLQDTLEVRYGPLHDPTALMFVRSEDLDPDTGALKPGVPVEPLVLRARMGECIRVELENQLPGQFGRMPDLDGWSGLPNLIDNFNANDIAPSSSVGLHADLLAYDVATSDGYNVGMNPVQTAAPGETAVYEWYAGDLVPNPVTQEFEGRPIEFGAVPLSSSDPIEHPMKGLVGALVIEPAGAIWQEDPDSRAAAKIMYQDPDSFEWVEFREFVVVMQNSINLRYSDGTPVASLSVNADSEESGQKGYNYRTEPVWFRKGYAPGTFPGLVGQFDFTDVFSNNLIGGDPQTPIFEAEAGFPVRFRVVHPGGHTQFHTFGIHGHVWEELPYVDESTRLGDNPLSMWEGSRPVFGPFTKLDALLKNGAGGLFQVPGDYMYRDYVPPWIANGMWGIFRVHPKSDPVPSPDDGQAQPKKRAREPQRVGGPGDPGSSRP